jgi:hypothetical protein
VSEAPDDRRAVWTRALVVTLVGFGVILLLQATVIRHGIEHDLTARALHELQAGSYGPVEIHFSGQDASVTVAEPGVADGVAAVVASVPGVRTVTVVTGISAPTSRSGGEKQTLPPPLIVELKRGVARARGSMPTTASVADLKTALKSSDRKADVSEVTVDESLAATTDRSQGWLDALADLVKAVSDDDAVVLDFTTGILGLSGTVATEDEHESILDAAAELVPSSAEAADGLEVVANR